MSTWIDTLFVVIPSNLSPVVNTIFALWDDDIAGNETFGIPRLSSNGKTPHSHLMCATRIRREDLTTLVAQLLRINGLLLWYESDGFDEQRILNDMNLKRLDDLD